LLIAGFRLKKIESEKMTALNRAAEHEKLALVGQIVGKWPMISTIFEA